MWKAPLPVVPLRRWWCLEPSSSSSSSCSLSSPSSRSLLLGARNAVHLEGPPPPDPDADDLPIAVALPEAADYNQHIGQRRRRKTEKRKRERERNRGRKVRRANLAQEMKKAAFVVVVGRWLALMHLQKRPTLDSSLQMHVWVAQQQWLQNGTTEFFCRLKEEARCQSVKQKEKKARKGCAWM